MNHTLNQTPKEKRRPTLKELHEAAYGVRNNRSHNDWETKQGPDDDDADCVCD